MLVELLLNIFCRHCARWKPKPDSDGHDVSLRRSRSHSRVGSTVHFFWQDIKEKKFKHLTSSMMETPQSCRSKWTQVPLENSGSARQTRGSRMTFLSNHSHSETLANSNSKGFSGFGSHEVWWSGSQPRADCTFRPCQMFFSQTQTQMDL